MRREQVEAIAAGLNEGLLLKEQREGRMSTESNILSGLNEGLLLKEQRDRDVWAAVAVDAASTKGCS